jgi:hypothetical protein
MTPSYYGHYFRKVSQQKTEKSKKKSGGAERGRTVEEQNSFRSPRSAPPLFG